MNVDWIGFAVASMAIVLAPGPNSVFLAKTAGTRGGRAGCAAMCGIMLGDSCLIVLSLLGVSALFSAQPALFHVVRLAGAGYLIFLGLQSILTQPKANSAVAQDAVLPFRRALTIALLNPKAIFFFMAFFPVFILSAEGGLVAPYVVMAVLFMAISATYLCVVIHVSSRIGRAFQESRTIQTVARKACGILFVGFGIRVAIASR